MLGAVAQPHQITLAEHGAIILDQLALENEKLFVAVVAVRPCGHAGGHLVDMEANTQRQVGIELQHAVAERQAIVIDERPEGGVMDIGNAPVFGFHGLHGVSPLSA